MQAEFELRDQQLQTTLDNTRQRNSELETACKMKKERVSANKARVLQVNASLRDVEASSSRLDTIIQDLSLTVCINDRFVS